jgi:hypothetical protein
MLMGIDPTVTLLIGGTVTLFLFIKKVNEMDLISLLLGIVGVVAGVGNLLLPVFLTFKMSILFTAAAGFVFAFLSGSLNSKF